VNDHWSPSRRALLRVGAGLVASSAVAGCLGSREEGYRIGSVQGLNRSPERHEIALRVLAGDETLYSVTHDLDPGSEDSPTGFLADERLPDEERPYEVEVRLNDRDWETTLTSDQDSYDCIQLLYLVERVELQTASRLSSFSGYCDSEE